MKNIKYIGMAMLAGGLLTACQADMDTPELEIPEATLTPNTTILELKQMFEGKTEQVGLKPGTDEHLIIHGRVVSSDASGNIYKSLVIQDETAALAFSLNQSSMYIENRLGQDIVVDMTDLYMGYYSGLQQVGYPDEPYNGEAQVGFMAYDYWVRHSQKDGISNPDYQYVRIGDAYPTDQYYCIVINSLDELSGQPLTEMQSQFVELRNVEWVDAGEEVFAPYQESVNRTLKFANGQNITVRNSGYSNFYNDILPEGRGNVQGILSYYGSDWQLVIRNRSDVMISTQGTEEDPFTVKEIIDPIYQGRSGWAGGYIVGSVKASVQSVASASDVIFGPDAELDNNVLVAENPDETDISKCAVIELTQGSMLRSMANLADHPENYKKKLIVDGVIGSWLGMPAVTGCTGSAGTFDLEGLQLGDGGVQPAATGDGSQNNPYNIGAVKEATGTVAGVWVEGYVAGYVAAGDWEADATFNDLPNTSSSYYMDSNNIILSEKAPLACGLLNSVPCQLNATSKPMLGLRLNPGIYGKHVKVKCDLRDLYGTRGIRNITEVIFIE